MTTRLVAALVTITALACATSAPPPASEPTVLRVVTTMPASDGLGYAPVRFAKKVNAITDGRLVVEIVPAPKAGIPLPKLFESVDAGQIDALASPPELFMTGGRPPPFGILLVSTFPFGFRAPEFFAWYYEGGGEALVQEIFERRTPNGNVIVFPIGATASEPPGYFKEPVDGEAAAFDARGLTYRINMLGGRVMKEAFPSFTIVGGSPFDWSAEDFCGGRFDGAEIGTLSMHDDYFYAGFEHPAGEDVVACGFRHLYLGSWQQPMLANWIAIDRSVYDALPASQQQALRTAAEASLLRSLANDFAGGADSLRKARDRGVTIHPRLPDALAAHLRETTARVLDREAAADADFAAILASMKAFARSRQPILLYDAVPRDERFNLFPGWESEIPVVPAE